MLAMRVAVILRALTAAYTLSLPHASASTTRYPEAPIYAVGYSLGANLLVKYLGEEGKLGYRPLAGAVAVSNPWNFEKNTVAGGEAGGIIGTILGKFYSLALTIGLRVRRLPLTIFFFLLIGRGVDGSALLTLLFVVVRCWWHWCWW